MVGLEAQSGGVPLIPGVQLGAVERVESKPAGRKNSLS